MPPAIWGVFTSLCWGAGDLAARYNGKRIGVANALFAMMLLSTVLLLAAELSFGQAPNFTQEGLIDLLIGSVLVLIATAALFAALVLGPISVAAPIASSYPVVTLSVAIAQGAEPTLWQALAMGAVLVGVWVLAIAGRNLESGGERPPGGVLRTVIYGLISALSYGLSIEFLKGAYAIHGPIWTVIWLRLICLFLMLGYFILVLRARPRFPKTLIPMLTFQGFVDGGGYVFLLIGAALPGGEIAVVVTAGYAVVSSLLARVLLKEMIGLTQWLAIVSVVGAVTYLAAG